MAQLAEHMPINVGDVVSCLHPVPPIVRRRAVEIARIVETAKQRKRRPSELLAMSPDNTVPIVQDNSTTTSNTIVEGDDWRVLRHLASECKMKNVSWTLGGGENKEDDIIETAERDVVGDLYVSNTSQDLVSLDSVRRELTEKIRSKSSRLWKALTRVDEDEDVVELEEEEKEDEEEEEKISNVPSISPAEALAQSILQERGEIKIDDEEEDKDDVIDGQLPKSILETYVMITSHTINSNSNTPIKTGTDNTPSVQAVENVVTRRKNQKRRTSHHHHHHHKRRKHSNLSTMTIWHLNTGPLQHPHFY